MVYQYTNDRPLILGSADIRVALYSDTNATFETAKSVGLLDGVTFTFGGTKTILASENSDDINLGASDVTAVIGASAWKNIDLSMLYDIIGHTGSYTITSASPVSVTSELVGLVSNIAAPLKHKTDAANPTEVSSIVVKSSDGATTYVEDTDYTVGLTATGYTTITRISSGSITSASTVKVSYSYTPASSKKLTYGSTITPVPLHVWLCNTDSNNKKFMLEVYKVEAIESGAFTYGSDKGKTPLTMPITLTGKPDSVRASANAADDTFSLIMEA